LLNRRVLPVIQHLLGFQQLDIILLHNRNGICTVLIITTQKFIFTDNLLLPTLPLHICVSIFAFIVLIVIIFLHTPEITTFPLGPIGTQAAIEIETDLPATIESVSFVYNFRNSLEVGVPGFASFTETG
jgi:hypothetical protein